MAFVDTQCQIAGKHIVVAAAVISLVGVLMGCTGGNEKPLPRPGGDATESSTPNPAIVRTYQAEVVMTAAWVVTLTPPATASSTPGLPQLPVLTGTPVSERRGDCPLPDGYDLQTRQGFCISAPQAWSVLNIDGGMAETLRTTPGQAISLQPDWADSTSVCYVLLYVATDTSIYDHLQPKYSEFALRSDLTDLSVIGPVALGDLGLIGFTWEATSGARGGVFAGMIDTKRLIHLSIGGTNCPLDQLLPVLETLRFN